MVWGKKDIPHFPSYEELFVLAKKKNLLIEITVEAEQADKEQTLYLVVRKQKDKKVLASQPISSFKDMDEIAGTVLNKVSKKV